MINLDRVGKSNGTMPHEYSARDVILYHLGIGAGAADLDLVYEKAAGGLTVCPTFAVVTLMEPLMKVLPQFNVPLREVLHGEQTIFLEFYIIHDDATGGVFADILLAAAARLAQRIPKKKGQLAAQKTAAVKPHASHHRDTEQGGFR